MRCRLPREDREVEAIGGPEGSSAARRRFQVEFGGRCRESAS